MNFMRFISVVSFVVILYFAGADQLQAQNQQQRPCDTPAGQQFDFWLGEWELTWPAEQWGGQKGDISKGTNSVTKILDDCIIQENFKYPDGEFNGTSLSVYNAVKRIWQQTWVDNNGGYLVFTGEFIDSRMELRTEVRETNDKQIVSRMVFKNITESSIDWDWQRSEDNGKTWQDVWNIHYERKK
jgi:hypothetical protein